MINSLLIICAPRYIWALAATTLLALTAGCAVYGTNPNQTLAMARAEDWSAKPHLVKEYILHPGDALTIKFYATPDLNEQTLIRPDGRVAMPLIGEVDAAGLSVPEFQAKLKEAYHGTLKNPQINVSVGAFDKQRVFVGGEVTHAGVLPLHDGMTALQAIHMAGGYRDTAEPTEVLVIREAKPGQPELLMVDLQTGLDEFYGVRDLPLTPHDIVMVPMSTIAKMDKFVDQWINQLIPVARSFSLNYNMGTLITQ